MTTDEAIASARDILHRKSNYMMWEMALLLCDLPPESQLAVRTYVKNFLHPSSIGTVVTVKKNKKTYYVAF